MEQFVVYTNQSILYSCTGVSGSVTGVGSDGHSILYNWFIPNHNTKDGISFDIGIVVRSTCVGCTKGPERGGNGRIILGGAVFDEEVFCTGLLGLVLVCGGVVPSAV